MLLCFCRYPGELGDIGRGAGCTTVSLPTNATHYDDCNDCDDCDDYDDYYNDARAVAAMTMTTATATRSNSRDRFDAL